MKFNEVFENATMLTDDFLKNECAYELTDMSPSQRKAIYRQYYINMCMAISDLFYLKPSQREIEELLTTTVISRKWGERYWSPLVCKETHRLPTGMMDADERKYVFLMAQYDQLVFDIANGRTTMLRGEDMKWKIAPDALSKLDMLGFCQRTYAVKW